MRDPAPHGPIPALSPSASRQALVSACLLTLVLFGGCRKSAIQATEDETRDRLAAIEPTDPPLQVGLPVYAGGPAHYTLEMKTVDDTLASLSNACAQSAFDDLKPSLITDEKHRPTHVFTLHEAATGEKRIYNANDASLLVVELREVYGEIRRPEDQMTCLHDLTDYLDLLTQDTVHFPKPEPIRTAEAPSEVEPLQDSPEIPERPSPNAHHPLAP